jgi:hypothetical protein
MTARCRTSARLLAPLALLALAVGTPPAGALPPSSGPTGEVCTVAAMTDVTLEAGYDVAAVVKGPLVTGAAGRLVCTIHVNNATHSGAYAYPPGPMSCAATSGVVACAPEVVHFRATAMDYVTACGEWVPASGTVLYWVGDGVGTGHWSTDRNSRCGVPVPVDPNPEACPLWLALDKRLGTNFAEIWQDCGLYQPIV